MSVITINGFEGKWKYITEVHGSRPPRFLVEKAGVMMVTVMTRAGNERIAGPFTAEETFAAAIKVLAAQPVATSRNQLAIAAGFIHLIASASARAKTTHQKPTKH